MLKNIFRLFSCLALTAFAFSQFVPDYPPETAFPSLADCPVTDMSETLDLHPGVMLKSAADPVSHGEYNIWHFAFTGASHPYRLLISIDQAAPTMRLYVRFPDGGYLGPYTAPHFSSPLHATELIFTETAVVEYWEPGSSRHLPGPEIVEIMPHQPNAAQSIPVSEPRYFSRNEREPGMVLLCGYWPPTNEMIRHFSQNPDINPGGWAGEDWEGRGYDVVSYFPEFDPPDCSNCGQGYGDLEVDYQDTSPDWWNIVAETQPIAIITFSRGNIDWSWEMEVNFFNRTNWIYDYTPPNQPTPNPPDENEPAYFQRYTNLPVDELVTAIDNADLGLTPWIDWNGHPGMFLSEFLGLHGVWYRDLNEYGEFPCLTAGHIHVGGQVDWDTARQAAEVSVRTILDYLDQFNYTPGDVNGDEELNVLDIVQIVNIILGVMEPTTLQTYAADLNQDSIINVLDVIVLLNILVAGE